MKTVHNGCRPRTARGPESLHTPRGAYEGSWAARAGWHLARVAVVSPALAVAAAAAWLGLVAAGKRGDPPVAVLPLACSAVLVWLSVRFIWRGPR